jgi:hypothetical protein
VALELTRDLGSSTDPNRTVDVLKSVGNAGNEATPDAIEPLLKDLGTARVRARGDAFREQLALDPRTARGHGIERSGSEDS